MAKQKGRKLILTDEMITEICSLSAQGFTRKGITEAVGIDESTFYDWQGKGDAAVAKENRGGKLTENELRYAKFKREFTKAQVLFKRLHLANIKKHSARSWQSSAWLLERTFPEEYGRTKQDLEISGKDGGPVNVAEEVHFYMPDNGRDKR